MPKNARGIELKQYPKLVRTASGKKVRVMNENEEKALPKWEEKAPKADTKQPEWKK